MEEVGGWVSPGSGWQVRGGQVRGGKAAVGRAAWTKDAGAGEPLVKSWLAGRGGGVVVGREELVNGGFPAAGTFLPRAWGRPLDQSDGC